MTFTAHRRDGPGKLEESYAKRPSVWRKPEVGGRCCEPRMTYESASLGFIQCGHRDLCGVFISVLNMVRLACDSCGDIVPEGVVLYWGISEYVLLRKGEAELQSL